MLDLSRWQFGITTVYHFIFVPLTIGLSILVAAMQTAWFIKKDPAYLRMTKFLGKLILINFAVGVFTVIALEFQFGMNWSAYSRFVRDVFGAPLAMEGLLAFFMESVFLGLWIFGWEARLMDSQQPAKMAVRDRARAIALRLAPAVVLLAAGFLVASQVAHGKPGTDVTAAVAAVALLSALAAAVRSREGWAFALTAITIVAAVATLFGDLWPNVLPSSTAAAFSAAPAARLAAGQP